MADINVAPNLFEGESKNCLGAPALNTGRIVRSQGYEAGASGKHLEDLIERTMLRFNFHVTNYARNLNNRDLLHGDLLIRNVPYKSIYGAKSRCEFEIRSERLNRRIRVECKWQEHSGSVDEKFPYFLANAKLADQDEVIIILGGGGYRCKALVWLKSAARASSKTIHVFNQDEFITWANKFSRQAA